MTALSTLPALKSLGDLADIRPTIIIDTREQDPLPFRRLPSVRSSLMTGDYSIIGLQDLFTVERKTIGDLVGCVASGRERFERELHRLRGFMFKRLLVVGTRDDIKKGSFRSRVKPSSVLHSLAAWEARYNLPVVFCSTPDLAGEQIETWAYWFAREHVENTNDLLRGHRNVMSEKTKSEV